VEQEFPSPSSLKTIPENAEEKLFTSPAEVRGRGISNSVNIQRSLSLSGSTPAETVKLI
jgi:hypothetical protein